MEERKGDGLVIIEVYSAGVQGRPCEWCVCPLIRPVLPVHPDSQVQYDLDRQWIRMSNFLQLERQTGRRISLDLWPGHLRSPISLMA